MAADTDFVVTMLDILRQFIERQKLVQQVLQALHPDFLLLPQIASSENPARILEQIKKYKNVPQEGIWAQDTNWAYFFHGGECRLTHRVTEESIDWGGDDPAEFDRYAFVDYVKWFLKQYPQKVDAIRQFCLENTVAFDEIVDLFLDRLIAENRLSKISDTRFRLT